MMISGNHHQRTDFAVAVHDLDAEQAETANFASIEQQRGGGTGRSNLRDVVSTTTVNTNNRTAAMAAAAAVEAKAKGMRAVVRRVMALQKAAASQRSRFPGSSAPSAPSIAVNNNSPTSAAVDLLQNNDHHHHHHRGDTMAYTMIETLDDTVASPPEETNAGGASTALEHGPHIFGHEAEVFQVAEGSIIDDDQQHAGEGGDNEEDVSSHDEASFERHHHHDENASLLNSKNHHTRRMSMLSFRYTKALKDTRVFGFVKGCLHATCHPVAMLRILRRIIVHSCLITVTIPLCLVALLLYYGAGNPKPDFLPDDSPALAWWCNLFARQTVTLELARLTHWINIQVTVKHDLIGRIEPLGPLLSLLGYHAIGWPFIVGAWAVWDMILLHGDNIFQLNWFYMTGWDIYRTHDNGKAVLNSPIYLRLLLSMLLLGVATAVKRTYTSLKFGRSQIAVFKPRLQRILADVVLLTDIGILASQVESAMNSKTGEEDEGSDRRRSNNNENEARRSTQLANVDFGPHHESDASADEPIKPGRNDPLRQKVQPSIASIAIRSQLETWDEPVRKQDGKYDSATFSDILNFRRALLFMEDEYPFGVSFGPTTNRNEAIASAREVYLKLLKLSRFGSMLPFDVLALVAVNDDGDPDSAKRKALERLFRPGPNRDVSMLKFVAASDSVYKRLCFYVASVENASVIDRVLGSIFDCVFYFVLGLALLSIMRLNPLALLLSLTSVLVSVSFALGSSVSKYVEGMFFIAVRRPFDLGDRIMVSQANDIVNPGVVASWFVEDIDLFTTTLRLARTNEVSTVHNYSLAGFRIVNCNRSPNAIVVLETKLMKTVLKDNKVDKFRGALEDYVRGHTGTWQNLVFCRHDEIDDDLEWVKFTISFCHRSSWQEAARVLMDRSDLVRFVSETVEAQGIMYDSAPDRRIMYNGGVYKRENTAFLEEDQNNLGGARGSPANQPLDSNANEVIDTILKDSIATSAPS